MSWYLWKHFRASILACSFSLASILVLLALEHLALSMDPNAAQIEACSDPNSGVCGAQLGQFVSRYHAMSDIGLGWMLLLPPIVGMFIGAPLVAREVESGTYRFLWTQGITRLRWFLVTVAAVIVALTAGFALLGLAASWALEPLLRAQALTLTRSRLSSPAFDVLGLLPAAFVAFAVAAGVVVGTVVRRTLAAMLVTIVLFAVVRVPFVFLARPELAAPITVVSEPNLTSALPSPVPAGSLVIDTGLIDRQGHIIAMLPSCGSTISSYDALQECYRLRGYRSYVTFEPPSRLVGMQLAEGSAFSALALGLLMVAGWIVRFRIS